MECDPHTIALLARRFMRGLILTFCLAATSAVSCLVSADEKRTPVLQIESALVTLIDQREIPARMEGPLARLQVREGQIINAGDEIAVVDDAEARMTLQRATLELEIARKQAENDVKVRIAKKSREFTRIEYQRAEESAEKYRKAVSETELERLRLAAERSVLDVEQSERDQETTRLTQQLKESDHELARHAVDRHKIVSPINGMIVQVHRREGEWVQPGMVVARMVRIDRLRVEAFVNAQHVTTELTGRAVQLAVNLPGKGPAVVEGTIVFVSPEINPVNGQIRVWAEVDNRDHILHPGTRGTLTIDMAGAVRAAR
jgi:multidrug resistance efflux pump